MKSNITISIALSLSLSVYGCGCLCGSNNDPVDTENDVTLANARYQDSFRTNPPIPPKPREVTQSPKSSNAPKAAKSRSVSDINLDEVHSKDAQLQANYIAHQDAYELSLSGFTSNIIMYDVISLNNGDERVIFSDTIYAAGSPIRCMLPISIDKNTHNYIAVTTKNQRWVMNLVDNP